MNEARFLRLISRSDPSLDERLMRVLLSGTASFYSAVIRWRNRLFDRGWKQVIRVDVPVVSIGNLTAGGTGKTPLVAYIVHWLKQNGATAGIISRGYRSLGNGNDEQRVLERLCPGTPHVQNRERIQAASQLLQAQRVDVLVADDAFQHRRLHRDLDIVLIDALNPWGYGHLLPRGLLREPPSSLQRAHCVILTRADQVAAEVRQAIWTEVRRWQPRAVPIEVAFEPTTIRTTSGEVVEHPAEPVVAFCGIGNPAAFRATLEQAGQNVVAFRSFPDHHHYSERDLDELGALVERFGATALVATLKDIVKLPRPTIRGRDVRYVDITARVLQGQAEFEECLRWLLKPSAVKLNPSPNS